MQIYIYNVTNADEFLNNGEKPALQELGPYVYEQRWEKVDIKFNDNGTVTYKVKKTFIFNSVSPYLINGTAVMLIENSRFRHLNQVF